MGETGAGRGGVGGEADPLKDYQKRRLDSIAYIQQMLGELRTLAEIERCDMLTYLIEMAYVEAGEIRRGQRPLRVGKDKRYEPTGVPLKAAS